MSRLSKLAADFRGFLKACTPKVVDPLHELCEHAIDRHAKGLLDPHHLSNFLQMADTKDPAIRQEIYQRWLPRIMGKPIV
jgi:hypothetical protein